MVAAILSGILAAPSRAQFAIQIKKVKSGMSESQVRAILGRPDDIRTQDDPPGFTYGARTYAYGSDRHLGAATLGTVHFDEDGKVSEFFGTRGKQVLPESQFRTLLRECTRPPNEDGYDPLFMMRAADRLRRLGRAKALDAIYELDALHSISYYGYWLTRLVFASKSGRAGDTPTGSGLTLANPSALPDYPLIIEDGIPFGIMHDGVIFRSGPLLPFSHYLKENESDFVLRPAPKQVGNPFTAAAKAIAQLRKAQGPGWKEDGNSHDFRLQAIRSARTAIAVPPHRPSHFIAPPNEFEKAQKLFQTSRAAWNQSRQLFLTPGKASLPLWDLSKPTWIARTSHGGIEFSATFVRHGKEVIASCDISKDHPSRKGTYSFRILDAKGKCVTWQSPSDVADSAGVTFNLWFLTSGGDYTMRVTFNGKTAKTIRSRWIIPWR